MCAAPKPSASSPNPPKPSNYCANIKTTTGTDPPNHQLLRRNEDKDEDDHGFDDAPQDQAEQHQAEQHQADPEHADPVCEDSKHRSLQLVPPPFDPDRPGPAPLFTFISAKKPSPPAPASPASKTSAPCSSADCAPCSGSAAASA